MVRKLLWHTHDLRLHDHAVLAHLNPEDALLPVYCFDPLQLKPVAYPSSPSETTGVPSFSKMGAMRLHFLVSHLHALREAYRRPRPNHSQFSPAIFS